MTLLLIGLYSGIRNLARRYGYMRPICFTRIAVVLLLAAVFPAHVRPQAASATPVSQSIAPGAYTDSPEGLKKLLQDLFASEKARETQKSSQYLASFAIPNHNEWFVKTFGATEGARLDMKYVELQAESAGWLKKRVEIAVKDAKTDVDVRVYQKPADARMPLMQAVLGAMVQSVPIYNASDRFDENDKSPFFLGDFVYLDGGFRYLEGQVLQSLTTAPPLRLRIGGNVQAAKIIKKVAPVYPMAARESHIEGTIRLHVIVAKDGTIKQIAVMDGAPPAASGCGCGPAVAVSAHAAQWHARGSRYHDRRLFRFTLIAPREQPMQFFVRMFARPPLLSSDFGLSNFSAPTSWQSLRFRPARLSGDARLARSSARAALP